MSKYNSWPTMTAFLEEKVGTNLADKLLLDIRETSGSIHTPIVKFISINVKDTIANHVVSDRQQARENHRRKQANESNVNAPSRRTRKTDRKP